MQPGQCMIPLECKAPCPFKLYSGPGENRWKYDSHKSWEQVVPASYFAQSQLIMPPSQAEAMLLGQYTPHTTIFDRVQSNVGWAAEMLQFMQLIHAVAVQQRRPGFLVEELTTKGPLAARYHASSRCTDNLHRSSIDGSVARISGTDVREFV